MKTVRVLGLFVCLAILSSCGGKEEAPEIANTLQRSVPTDPETLDLHKARSTQAADILRDIGEGLVGHSPTGDVVPAAAESWDVSDDGLTYTFHLRSDLRWSNGDALTAKDFVTAFRRLVDPSTAALYAQMLADLDNADGIVSGDIPVSMLGVEATDDTTLVLRLVRPTPYLISLLTHPSTHPIHTPSLEEFGEAFARPGQLVSNGAYTLQAWVPGSIVQLQRNEHYWNDAATAIDKVNYHVIVEDSSELNRFRAGELHVTSTVPPDNFAQIREEYGEQLRVAPYLGVYYFGYNLTKPPFTDNAALRQALSMAIDREELAEKVMGRGEIPAYSWVHPGVKDYEPVMMGFAELDKDERIQLARRLYKEAGYSEGNPLEVEVRYNTSDTHRRIATAVQSMWREALGFEATLINEEFQVLLANMRDAEVTQVFRSSWIGDYRDAHTFLSILRTGNPANMPRYSSEDFDDFMARAGAALDPKQRRVYLEEAERLMLADFPIIPVYFYSSRHLVSPEIQGWGDNVLDYHYSQHLSFKAAE